jgi:hypothetical protein
LSGYPYDENAFAQLVSQVAAHVYQFTDPLLETKLDAKTVTEGAINAINCSLDRAIGFETDHAEYLLNLPDYELPSSESRPFSKEREQRLLSVFQAHQAIKYAELPQCAASWRIRQAFKKGRAEYVRDNRWKPPRWLVDIGERVRELIQKQGGLDFFLKKLNEWYDESKASWLRDGSDRAKQTEITHARWDEQKLPLQLPLPERPISLCEKVAILSAIHDVTIAGGKLISGRPDAGFVKRNADGAYKDEPQLRKFIADVETAMQIPDRNLAPPESKKRKPKVDDRMKAEMASNLETVKGWTAQEWANFLGCGKSTVIETKTWRSLSFLRQQVKAEKRKDRHGTKPV